MLNLKERPQMVDNTPVAPIATAPLVAALPVKVGENTGHSKPWTVLGVGKRARLKIATGIVRIGRVVSGPPMSDRDRSRYAINAFQIQKHIGIAASWPHYRPK